MKRLLASLGIAACAVILGGSGTSVAAQGSTGTIAGRVRLTSPAPANSVIRMGADPRCSRALGGRRVTQDVVLRSADGGLANAFVSIQGRFPAAAAPAEPVTIDQSGCVFVPRVVGARVGQTLRITNSDPTAHNVHSVSARGNAFNTGQPLKGSEYKFQLKAEDVMMRIRCDIHSWMTPYVGVVPHPYFAVSAGDGAFTIARVPAGRHTVQVWHERYGVLARTIDVKAGATATLDIAYAGSEKPSRAGMRDLVVPAGPAAITLAAAR